MSYRRLIPAFFSLLLLAALCMRLGLPLIMIFLLTVMLMVALFVPWPQMRKVMAIVLGLESVLWAVMTVVRVRTRLGYEEPWMRLAAILAGVTLFTAWAGWLLWPRQDETA